MAGTRPTEPHLFLTEDGITCKVCGLPPANARHTGASCGDCGHLVSDHNARTKRYGVRARYCRVCHLRCTHV